MKRVLLFLGIVCSVFPVEKTVEDLFDELAFEEYVDKDQWENEFEFTPEINQWAKFYRTVNHQGFFETQKKFLAKFYDHNSDCGSPDKITEAIYWGNWTVFVEDVHGVSVNKRNQVDTLEDENGHQLYVNPDIIQSTRPSRYMRLSEDFAFTPGGRLEYSPQDGKVHVPILGPNRTGLLAVNNILFQQIPFSKAEPGKCYCSSQSKCELPKGWVARSLDPYKNVLLCEDKESFHVVKVRRKEGGYSLETQIVKSIFYTNKDKDPTKASARLIDDTIWYLSPPSELENDSGPGKKLHYISVSTGLSHQIKVEIRCFATVDDFAVLGGGSNLLLLMCRPVDEDGNSSFRNPSFYWLVDLEASKGGKDVSKISVVSKNYDKKRCFDTSNSTRWVYHDDQKFGRYVSHRLKLCYRIPKEEIEQKAQCARYMILACAVKEFLESQSKDITDVPWARFLFDEIKKIEDKSMRAKFWRLGLTPKKIKAWIDTQPQEIEDSEFESDDEQVPIVDLSCIQNQINQAPKKDLTSSIIVDYGE